MNRDQIDLVLETLVAAFPNQELTGEILDLWHQTLSPERAERVEAAVMLHIEREAWWPTIAGLRELMREVQTEERTEQLSSAVRCGGYGWIVTAASENRPCPTCNSALWTVFRDPILLRQYRSGRKLHDIFNMKREAFIDEFSRPACQKDDERIEHLGLPAVHPREGRTAALAALRASGVEPTKGMLRMLGSVG